jgi:ABC-2 type transport system permease protein
MEMVGQFFITFADFAIIAVLLTRFPSVNGWSLPELAFLYGLASISFNLAQFVSRGFEIFDRFIQMGELDRVLTRPVSPFLQILGIELALNRLGRLGQSLVVLGFGIAGLNLNWDLAKIGVLLMALMAGMVVFLALFVIGAVTTIWTVSTVEFINIFTNGGAYMSSYPLTIYQEWFRNFFLFIVPLGFVTYMPATLILGKSGLTLLPDWAGWLALPVAVAFFGLSLLIWNWGLKKYQSTGT